MKKAVKITISYLTLITTPVSSIVSTISCSKSEEPLIVVPDYRYSLRNIKYGMTFNSNGDLLDYPILRAFNIVIPSKLDVDDPNSEYYGFETIIDDIGNTAFKYRPITSVEIPNTVESIGSSAFEKTQLTHVKIPDSVTYIYSNAFANTPLTHVTIPDSVKEISYNAFIGTKITQVTLPPDCKYYSNSFPPGTTITGGKL